MKTNKCDSCVTDRANCGRCCDNPIYADVPRRSLYQNYIPVCPRGYSDCVCDPAYINFYHHEWYLELYGDIAPEEAVKQPNGCLDRLIEDPEEYYYCYDDEDKQCGKLIFIKKYYIIYT